MYFMFMKKVALLIVAHMFITNCSLNKVEKHHGSVLLEEKKSQIIINKSNKNDVRNILGPPSTSSFFDDENWFYIDNLKTSSRLSKLGKKKLIKNDVLVLVFNKYGILINKKSYKKNDMNKINFENEITEGNYQKKSFIYNLLKGLKDKVNDPLGTKRIK